MLPRWGHMSNIIQLQPYRIRKRRRTMAAACRAAVTQFGMLVIQDQVGRMHTLTGQFLFLETEIEIAADSGLVTRIRYDDIMRVRVPRHIRHDGGWSHLV
jgi:hypothetical protein